MKKKIVLLICLMLILCSCEKKETGSDNKFIFDILDTGKSDCMIIQMDDINIINDTGDKDDFQHVFEKLDSYSIDVIDYMILSHFDNDHIGSAAYIIENYDVKYVMVPDYTRDSELYDSLITAVENSETEIIVLKEDYNFHTENGEVWINAPQEEEYDDDNNYSLITSVYYKDYSFLLLGDALKLRIQEFNSLVSDEYTFVKIAHHGSYNKGIKALLTNIQAQYAAITSEDDSTIEEDLIKKLKKMETQVFLSYDGDISISILDGIEIFQE